MVQLTKKLILSRARAHDLSGVKTLNCWGNELTDVTILKEVPNVEVINASVNEIKHLEAFSSCQQLRELYLRRNQINSIEELGHLADLKNLKFVWLSGNPFCESLTDEEYRQAVIKMLPQLQKLDNNVVTSSELQKALQSTLESRERNENESELQSSDKDLDKSNSHSLQLSASYSSHSSLKEVVKSKTSPPTSRPLPPLKTATESGDFLRASSTRSSIDTKTDTAINLATEAGDTLEETNKLRVELGLKPISPAKFNLSVVQPYTSHRRHKKHTGGNNVLKATLYLLDELDRNGLLALQSAVQDKLEVINAEETSKELRELVTS